MELKKPSTPFVIISAGPATQSNATLAMPAACASPSTLGKPSELEVKAKYFYFSSNTHQQ